MRNPIIVLIMVVLLGGMGGGGDLSAPSRVNPPSPAEVDAAQAAPPRVPEAGESGSLPVPARPELHILPAAETTPGQFLWQARPVVVFADTQADPAFLRQIQALQDLPGPLLDRDVVVISDTEPAAASVWRRQLHPRGFSLVIIDKDGQVKQRRPQPWSVREITRAIDKFPLRLEEIGRAGMVP
ncbi:MAG: DUF4174 domain-containing protein [Paracoccus sp. (in: a-proteobacteria)]|nr:DUF4174 domain-containing protein [Paracoccus sp. (in: a-proteobacteria)]